MEENGHLVTFIYAGREAVMEESEAYGSIRYIRGTQLLSSDSEQARTYYHYASDEKGSITHVVEERGKESRTVNRYTYDAFGNFTGKEEEVTNRFGYTGEIYDPATEQYYLRARFYSPATGRFLNEDSYYGDGLNLYSYCRNNPVRYRDPSGHDCKKEGGSGSTLKINELPLAKPGEDLYVGTYSKSSYWNKKTGLNKTHTPHHAVQDAVSSVSHGKGITINIRKDIHLDTETYGSLRTGLTNRQHLAADVAELRVLLKEQGYSRSTINAQLNELIKQNKALGGFEK